MKILTGIDWQVDVKRIYEIAVVEERFKLGVCNVPSSDFILFLDFYAIVFSLLQLNI